METHRKCGITASDIDTITGEELPARFVSMTGPA